VVVIDWWMGAVLEIVVDTNIFLHYRQLDEIDWCKLAATAPVRLVVCMPVVHELDDKKSHPTLHKRAEQAIQTIHRVRAARGLVRNDVTLAVDHREVGREDMHGSLRYDSPDDRILVVVQRILDAGGEVAVATEDLGMRLKCEARDIRIVTIPESLRLQTPADELTKRLRKAEAQVDTLRSRRSTFVLEVRFDGLPPGESDAAPASVRPSPLVDVEGTMHRARVAYALSQPTGEEPPDFLLGLGRGEPDPFHDFVPEFRSYLLRLQEFANRAPRTVSVWLWLHNTGTLPSTDIDVEITVPKAKVELLSPYRSDPEAWYSPGVPPPLPNGEPTHPLLRTVDIAQLLPTHPEPDSPDYPLDVRESDKAFVLSSTVDELRHKRCQFLGRIEILLRHGVAFAPFGVEYTVQDAVNADPVQSTAIVRLGSTPVRS
jgi:hypothetical protein